MKLPNTEFVELGRRQTELFNWDRPGIVNANKTFINLLVTCYSFRQIMVMAYKSLVAYKVIVAIENLTEDQKNVLFESTLEFTGRLIGKDKCIDICRALYVLEFYLQ